MECKTVSMTLDDLMIETDRRLHQKLKKIHDFDSGQNHAYGLKPSDELENRKQEITNLKKELSDLTNGIKELKAKKEALSKTLDERETRLDFLEEAVEQNKIKLEKEIKEFNENHAKIIQELDKEFKREIDEANRNFNKEIIEINKVNKRLNQEITTLTDESVGMKNELKEFEAAQSKFCQDINYFQAYIGRVCLILQAIMYHIVLPDQFAEDYPYKVKDIEEDIDDEYLLDDQERQEAWKRWVGLKEKLCWEPSIEKTLKMLQKEGSYMANPEGMTVEEAERVAEELNNQGRLRGRTSYEKVKKIINMWKISYTLAQSLP